MHAQIIVQNVTANNAKWIEHCKQKHLDSNPRLQDYDNVIEWHMLTIMATRAGFTVFLFFYYSDYKIYFKNISKEWYVLSAKIFLSL